MIEHDQITLTTELQQLISIDQAWHYSIIPKQLENGSLTFYIDKAKNQKSCRDELMVLLGKSIIFEPVETDLIHKALGMHYRKGLRSKSERQPQINYNDSDDFLFKLISEAHSIGSSDIHIETYDDFCRVRMRIDGKLIERYVLDQKSYPSLVNKIKIKANLDIAEKRLPQDGRIIFSNSDAKFDIRVSILPTLFGEKIVLRLLSKDATTIDIKKLGFDSNQLDKFLRAVQKPHGIILISGPTGSGKTTTLYATLRILNNETTNILTIEDPVEYTLKGINQVQLKETIGLTFSAALRTFLRQDPDIIMVGEIRDGETAQIAIRAALTGHLVLSTIHTNSAWGTISRLTDMGVPAFLLAGTINLTAAQRLVRLLCPKCKVKMTFSPALFPDTYKQYKRIEDYFIPQGCEECYYTGYRGRKAIYEILSIDSELSELIRKGSHLNYDILKRKNISTLSDSAFSLFEKGETSIEEVYSILANDIH